MSATLSVSSHIRALLFDCDGTLVDTMPLHWQAWQEGLRELGIEVPVEFIATYRGATVADIVRANHGQLPMAVVSGGSHRNVMASLEATGLDSFFPVVLTSDDPFPGKPAPDIMLEAARRLGVAPEFCQVFEDGDLGIDAARAAGMLATDVRPFLGVP